MDNKKTHGKVYTPQYMVRNMLNYAEYIAGKHILKKHFMDNSCGNGAFLVKAVVRYIRSAMMANLTTGEIVSDLGTYIHGIDNDRDAVAECVSKLDMVAEKYCITGVKWDIRCEDTLTVTDYDGRMDFVVGNPPYVRVHNLSDRYGTVKGFSFTKSGMADLYLVFFEIGFRMLSPTGVMCYITPSSWLNSMSGSALRKHIGEAKNLSSIVDFGHCKVFRGNSTYTIVTVFNNAVSLPYFDYYRFNEDRKKRELMCLLSLEEACIDGKYYLGDKSELGLLRDIMGTESGPVTVKNGFATLSDKSFIGDDIPDSPITIPVLKASTGKMTKCLFPYGTDGTPLPYDEVFRHENVASHLNREMEHLSGKKSDGGEWFLFGRSQAVSDVYKPKIAVNNLIRDFRDLKISQLSEGVGVYSGFYILGDVSVEDVKEVIMTDEFTSYVKLLRKYKSGGYYTFGAKDLEKYINYILNEKH